MKVPGMRILKTALAVVVCAFTIDILNEYVVYDLTPFYACITAVFTLDQTHDISKLRGKNRFLGTIVGMSIAILISFLRISLLNNSFEYIFLFVGIVLALYVVDLFKIKFGAMIACIMVIGSFSLHQDDYVIYSILRAIETMYGAYMAIIINKYIFPYNK